MYWPATAGIKRIFTTKAKAATQVLTDAIPVAISKTLVRKINIFHASASCLAYQRRLSKACFAVEIM